MNKSIQSKPDKDKIYIQMLGDMVITYNGNVLSGEKVRAKQLWSLLEYILVNRNSEITLDRLSDMLWPEEDIENPASALKNLVYRLRNVIKKNLLLENQDCIVFKHGAYNWNKEIDCIIDAEEFESAIKLAKEPGVSTVDEKMYLEKAINLYKGDFLPQSAHKEWVLPIFVYYQRLFMESVDRLCNIYLEEKKYAEAKEISAKGIAIDQFVETNHYLYINSLIGLKSYEKALDHYNYTIKMFYDELGARPSNLFSGLRDKIVKTDKPQSNGIKEIKEELRESEATASAIYCEYETFKFIYRLEARASSRSGKSLYLSLITITKKDESNLPKKDLEKNIDSLIRVICNGLRRDDVVTRYGRTQFLLLLSNVNYENTQKVTSRLISKINKLYLGKDIKVYEQKDVLDPIEITVK